MAAQLDRQLDCSATPATTAPTAPPTTTPASAIFFVVVAVACVIIVKLGLSHVGEEEAAGTGPCARNTIESFVSWHALMHAPHAWC